MPTSNIDVQSVPQGTEVTPKPSPDLSKLPSTSKQLQWSYQPSPDGMDANLLIFLHGLGDTRHPFFRLGQSFNLPQTAVLSLQAPDRVPLLDEDAFQWMDSFDGLGDIIERPNPTKAVDLLKSVLQHLVETCGWPAKALHVFGFAQGGSAAAETVLGLSTSKESDLSQIGSLVSVAGPLLSFPTLSSPSATPVCLARRSDDRQTTLGPFRKGFSTVQEHVMPAGGAGMPRSQPEWFPIMK